MDNISPFNTAYPATRYETVSVIDFSKQANRDRLSSDAIRVFFNIAAHWRIRDIDARLLLGGVSNGVYYSLKKGQERPLNEDKLTRISYLIGIFKALNVIYSEELADRWIKLPNKNRIFRGATPLEFLIQGGIPAFAILRKLLDARQGGN